jgi:hypothetical protein
VLTSTFSPFFLLISARAIGEVIEMRPLLGVGLGLADDLPDLLLVGVLVDQRDGRAEGDRVT